MDSSGVDSLVKALLHTLWQGGAIFLLLSVALAVIPVRRASLRYGVSLSALLAVLLLGIGTWAWIDVSAGNPTPSHRPTIAVLHHPSEAPRESVTHAAPTTHVSLNPSTTPQPLWGFQLPPSILFWIGMTWGVGVLASLIRCSVALIGAGNLRRRSQEINDPTLLALASALCRKLNLTRPIRLLVSEQIQLPAMIGLLRPAVLLPSSLLTGLPPEYLRAVLAHEIAHIARWDYLVNLGQMILEALLFFNPFVWWISRQVRLEREACCDLAATGECDNAGLYIKAILACAETPSAALPAAALTLGNRSDRSFVERVRRLLVPSHSGSIRIPWVTLAGILAVAAVFLFALGKGALWTAKRLTPKERIEQTEKIQKEVDPFQGGPKAITIAGKVLTEDGAPVPENAQFILRTESPRRSSAESIRIREGAFKRRIETSTFSLGVIADGYAPAYLSNLPAKGDYLDLELVMKKGFPAKFIISDAEGNPLEGVTTKGRYTREPSVGHLKTVTDANGIAALPAVGPEPMEFELSKPGFQTDPKATFQFQPDTPLRWVMHAAPTIRGRVISQETGKPVSDVKVSMLCYNVGGKPGTSWSPNHAPVLTTTNQDGEFSINELRPDTLYSLQFKMKGYRPFIQWGLTTRTIPTEVRLAPSLTIKGTVILKPPYPEEVELQCRQSILITQNHSSGVREARKAKVKDGIATFEFNELYAAETTLTTNAGDESITLRDFIQSLENVTLDLTKEKAKGTGSERPMRWVGIRFTRPRNAPAPGGSIAINRDSYHSDNRRYSETVTEPVKDGEVWIEVPLPNRLTLEPYGLIGYSFAKHEVTVEEGNSPLLVNLPVSPAGAFLGKIYEANGSPAFGCFITVIDTGKPVKKDDSLPLNPSSKRPNTTGSFVATPLPFGRSYAFIANRDQTFAQSAPVFVDEKSPMPGARVDLPEGVTVAGKLVSESGEPIALIPYDFVFSLSATNSYSSSGMTDGEGGFKHTGINFNIAGEYQIEFRPVRDYVPTTVKLSRKNLTPKVVLKKGRRITGTVINSETGLPFAGIELHAFLNPHNPNESTRDLRHYKAEDATDSNGKFVFSNLPPGRFSLNSWNANLADTRAPVIVESGQTEPVVLMMKQIPTR